MSFQRSTQWWFPHGLGAVFCALTGSSAVAVDNGFSVTTGVEFTKGNYGGDRQINEWYVPLRVAYVGDAYTATLTVPYLSYSIPAGADFIDAEGVRRSMPGERASGLGDVKAAVSGYDLLGTEEQGYAFDLTGEVKFGTGDPDKGLGTGENDYTVQGSIYLPGQTRSFWGGVGHVSRGDPDAYELRNTWYGILDWGVVLVTGKYSAGFSYTWEQAAFAGNDPVSEVTLYLSEAATSSWRGTLYLLGGLSDSSPDWGIGYTMTVDWRRPGHRAM